MSTRLKIGDTVEVTAGSNKGRTGTIEAKRSVMFVVVFRDGTNAQLQATALKKVTA